MGASGVNLSFHNATRILTRLHGFAVPSPLELPDAEMSITGEKCEQRKVRMEASALKHEWSKFMIGRSR